jgi:hypothetical protein
MVVWMDISLNTNTSQVMIIHGVHSERRVLAKVTKDLSNCFGCGDVKLSIPVTFPIPMCCVKKNGSCEYFIKYKNTHQIEPRAVPAMYLL